MTPERWQRVYDLFNEASKLAPADRDDMLSQKCAGDPDLRTQVEKLLASDALAEREDFLSPPVRTHRDTKLGPSIRTAQTRCPNCDIAIEIVALPSIEEVTCPSCRLSFLPDDKKSSFWEPSFGERAIGRFDLAEMVGFGTFGTVYKAYDPILDRNVALKLLRAGELASPDEKSRFMEEARRGAQLHHRAIVRVHEFGEHKGVPFIISDFIDGTTLAQTLLARRPSFEDAAKLSLQLAEALHYAHTSGVYHRDVKPQNIMIDREGRPFIMDFGLAKREANQITMTITGQILGTPAYMSPEQAKGEGHKVDARSDVYSLGVILYEMLTCELPFRGNMRMLLRQVIEDDPKPPRRLNDRVPRDLESICLCAIAKEPWRRYASAQAYADDLKRFLDNKPTKARPIGRIEQAFRWLRRNPRLGSALLATAASLVAVAVTSSLYAVNRSRMLAESNKHLSQINYELGRAASERGEIGAGLLHMVASHQAASASGDADWTRLARLNLAAWSRELPAPKAVFTHTAEVKTVEFSPLNDMAVTASYDGTARLWNLATGQPLSVVIRHDDSVEQARFSPDGKTVATVSHDKTAKISDVGTGQTLRTIQHDVQLMSVDFSRDGQTLMTRSDDKFFLWNSATGQPLCPPLSPPKKITAFALRGDGKAVLACTEDKKARIWDVGTGLVQGEPITLTDESYAAAFSPDGKSFAIGSNDGVLRIWEVGNPNPRNLPVQSGALQAVVFSPNGETFISAGKSKRAHIWNTTTLTPVGIPVQHDDAIWSVEFSRDGNTFVTASWDKTARLWNAKTGEPLERPFRHQGFVNTAVISPDGSLVLSASADRSAKLWSVSPPEAFELPLPRRGSVLHEIFSPDGKNVLIGIDNGEGTDDGVAILCDPETRQPRGVTLPHGGRVCRVAISPDGAIACTGGIDGKCQLWQLSSGQALGSPILFQNRITDIAFSMDNKYVLIGSKDKTGRIFGAQTGEPIGASLTHDLPITTVAFSPDGKSALTTSEDGTARLWNTANGLPLAESLQHNHQVWWGEYSPDGKTVLTASFDGAARFWDAATGNAIGIPLKHHGRITVARYSPDGQFVATAGSDFKARLWAVSNAAAVGEPLVGNESFIWSVAFSRDGRYLLTLGDDHTARLWDTALARPIGPPMKHPAPVLRGAFSPDGSLIMTGCDDNVARLWKTPKLAKDDRELREWAERITGLELTEGGEIRPLETIDWAKRDRASTPDTAKKAGAP